MIAVEHRVLAAILVMAPLAACGTKSPASAAVADVAPIADASGTGVYQTYITVIAGLGSDARGRVAAAAEGMSFSELLGRLGQATPTAAAVAADQRFGTLGSYWASARPGGPLTVSTTAFTSAFRELNSLEPATPQIKNTSLGLINWAGMGRAMQGIRDVCTTTQQVVATVAAVKGTHWVSQKMSADLEAMARRTEQVAEDGVECVAKDLGMDSEGMPEEAS